MSLTIGTEKDYSGKWDQGRGCYGIKKGKRGWGWGVQEEEQEEEEEDDE